MTRLWKRIEIVGDCWIYGGKADEYGYISVAGRAMRGSRFAYESLVGPIPDGFFVCHNCPGGDNPGCVNPAHMFLGTQGDNMKDASRKNRLPRGSNHHSAMSPERVARGSRLPHAKLHEAAVVEIRRLVAIGASQRAVARQFSVRHATVGDIINGVTWRHVR